MRKSGAAPVTPKGGDGLPILNHSQLLEWMKCRYRLELTTVRGINSRAVIRPLTVGSAIHAGMEGALRRMGRPGATPKRIRRASQKAIDAWISSQVDIRGGEGQMTEDETHDLSEVQAEAPVIVQKALEFIDLDRFTTLITPDGPAVELPILIPYPGWGGFHVTIDWAVRDKHTGGAWIWDYKFRSSLAPDEAEDYNLQMAVYQRVLWEKYGIETEGTMMFQGRNTAPKIPKLNQNGTMSRSDIATDWDTYRDELLRNGLDPVDYDDMRIKLADKRRFKLTPAYRPMSQVDNIWEHIVVPAAADLKRFYDGQSKAYRSMHQFNCNGCWARPFCLAELREEDTDFLLSTSFINLNDPAERMVLTADDMRAIEAGL